MNGDGHLDLVIGTNGKNNVFMQNRGVFNIGTYGESQVLDIMDDNGITHECNDIAWFDGDGDGDLDLACVGTMDSYRHNLVLFRNDGGGVFVIKVNDEVDTVGAWHCIYKIRVRTELILLTLLS